jgi:hypothetical protein
MRTSTAALPLLAALALLTACASGAADTAPGPPAAPAAEPTGRPAGELTTRAFVLDEGDGAQLCFGALESLPPQCGGPLIIGWDWDEVEGEERAAGSTWGDYEVFGTWDGSGLTLTRAPVPDDPRLPSTEAPRPAPAPGDPADAATVARAVEDFRAADADPDDRRWVTSSDESQGRALVNVIHDDGTLQAEADAEYGPGIVEIASHLRPAAEG